MCSMESSEELQKSIARKYLLPVRQVQIRRLSNNSSSAGGGGGQVLYCICRQPDPTGFMIACDHCCEWFHGSCIGITPKDADNIVKYYCTNCHNKYPARLNTIYIKNRRSRSNFKNTTATNHHHHHSRSNYKKNHTTTTTTKTTLPRPSTNNNNHHYGKITNPRLNAIYKKLASSSSSTSTSTSASNKTSPKILKEQQQQQHDQKQPEQPEENEQKMDLTNNFNPVTRPLPPPAPIKEEEKVEEEKMDFDQRFPTPPPPPPPPPPKEEENDDQDMDFNCLNDDENEDGTVFFIRNSNTFDADGNPVFIIGDSPAVDVDDSHCVCLSSENSSSFDMDPLISIRIDHDYAASSSQQSRIY